MTNYRLIKSIKQGGYRFEHLVSEFDNFKDTQKVIGSLRKEYTKHGEAFYIEFPEKLK